MSEVAAQRDEQALRLYLAGFTLREVAERLSFPTTRAAYGAVRHGLAARAHWTGEQTARSRRAVENLNEAIRTLRDHGDP